MKLFKTITIRKHKSTATNLRKYRLKHEITLRDLAKQAKISPSTLSDIERKVTNTTNRTSIRIVLALHKLIKQKKD